MVRICKSPLSGPWLGRNDLASATHEYHQVREEAMKKVNLAARRAQLDTQVKELEAQCSAAARHIEQLQRQMQPLEAERTQRHRWGRSASSMHPATVMLFEIPVWCIARCILQCHMQPCTAELPSGKLGCSASTSMAILQTCMCSLSEVPAVVPSPNSVRMASKR